MCPGVVPLATSDLTIAFIAAGAGLAGTLLGSLLPLYTQRAARKRASEAAWRLLRIEAGNARDAVYEIREKGDWPVGWRRTWSSAWRDSREHLLVSPPRNDGLTPVAAALARIDELENAVNTGRDEGERKLSDSDQDFLWRMQLLLEPACEALGYRSEYDEKARPGDPAEDRLSR
jgi:hypothetical protein